MGTQLTVSGIRHQSWALMFQEQARSGLSVDKWCKQQGISKKTYYYRRKRVQEELLQTASPVFAELIPQQESAVVPGTEDFEPAMVISVDKMSISVGNNATKQLLFNLFEAVRHA